MVPNWSNGLYSCSGSGRNRLCRIAVSRQNMIRCILLVCTLCPSSFSSSAIAVITSEGIILGVDGKSVDRCLGPCPTRRESARIVFVQERIALGTVGLYAALGDAHNIPPYYFPTLAGRIKSRLPTGASVYDVSEILREEVEKVFAWFDVYLKRGLLQQKDSPGEFPVEYLIAGYQADVPTIYSVSVEVDWEKQSLKGIRRVLVHPKPNGKRDLPIYGVGSKRVLQELREERGDLYQRIVSKAPLESRLLLGRKELSVNQARNLVGALLEVEAEANPEQVGPPFTIVALLNKGPAPLTSDSFSFRGWAEPVLASAVGTWNDSSKIPKKPTAVTSPPSQPGLPSIERINRISGGRVLLPQRYPTRATPD